MKKIKPKVGQESVWDYPRPPVVEAVTQHLRIVFNQEVIADTNQSYRVLETSHPPTYYLPISSFKKETLVEGVFSTACEFKGIAFYYDIRNRNRLVSNAAWGYPTPKGVFKVLQGHIAVYAHKMDACYVGNEKVQAQEGDFYGGWITSKIVGPFKGAKGTWGW
ncbi:DUF427 domain-containing protein [Marivirga harenae]|uniref:DUF427 domain-containing protein n=1 Tax=Marivirga harenae TaxID=2010992 RepID=UPI0026DFA1C8|nr:DUF427 domain-containing protein [Marivirga harenae]WKV11535.1 DUF427 domain-containing protein [Marivirga harenae]|tara:strand:- start:19521 stop:20009 length:489 start_codon:yes stop_codon:yes gene_type:complete